ncbi:DUF6538 domain-containing protein [Pseudorhodoferax sp.]|uniref:DUF6538 domain-containing protein n=1 Tax=Pseudorhodoferax sp. TaxID=1993553 RepID=UPI002DD6330C|nr:DUF6538 domain-containing protein [Pseudorhodoferax sp.]
MTMPTGVLRRGGVYWLRVGIPDDLRHLYPRTSKGALATDRYRASLKTSDKAEARIKALALRAQFEAEFLEKRRGMVAPPMRPAPVLQAAIAEQVYRERMLLDEKLRKDKPKTVRSVSGVHVGPLEDFPAFQEVSRYAPLPADVVARRTTYNTASLDFLRRAVASGNLDAMLPIAKKATATLGFEVDWNSDEGAATLEACLQSYARAVEKVPLRDAGQIVETPPAPEKPQDAPGTAQDPSGSHTPSYRVIRDLVPLWKAKTKPTAEAQGDMDRALRLLDASGIPTELATLKGIHGATFRDWLRDTEARGISQQTASHRFGAIKTLLNRAVEYGANEALTANPWAAIRFPVEGSKRREPFRHEELRAIHQSEQFRSYVAPSATGKGSDAVPYWMPLLGLYSGARVGELTQLEVADVREHNDVWVLDIHEEAEGSTVKTENGVRHIPVHPELVRLGFLDYVADLKSAGETKLFPTLHRKGAKTAGYLFGQAFRVYLDKVGVTRPLATFHAYRHGFRSALENAGVSAVRIHRIVGHADGSVDARYTHLDTAVLADDVAKVTFPFLDLPRVYPNR